MFDVTRMNGATVGFGGEYDIPDVPHAMRLTDSGTFLHGNYWAPPDAFGSVNVSHGCVGPARREGRQLRTPRRAGSSTAALVGDVVEVVNSKDKKVAPDNGLSGWNMGWKEWKAGSASEPLPLPYPFGPHPFGPASLPSRARPVPPAVRPAYRPSNTMVQ